MGQNPEDLKYTKTHEWIREQGDYLQVGITNFAQKQLTDIVYVDLPKKGAVIKRGDVLLTVESVKSAEEVFSPVSGEVVEVNEILESKPESINEAPFETWMVKIKPSGEQEEMMNAKEYEAYITK
jgi:glycine cleavage system H protein